MAGRIHCDNENGPDPIVGACYTSQEGLEAKLPAQQQNPIMTGGYSTWLSYKMKFASYKWKRKGEVRRK